MDRFAMIAATGSYLPATEVSNDALRERFAQQPKFVDLMEESSSIRRRWYAPDHWATSDVALPAAQQALERAGIRPDQVDLIILGTDSPDYITPATSVVLQHKLGAVNAGTFDISCACASFPTALASAAGWIATNPSIKTVLVVGAYLMHKLADPADPAVFFYGDGAGAVVLVASERPGFIGAAAQADGSYHKHWGIYSGGTYEPASVASVQAGRTQVRLVERYPPEVNHEGWPRLVRKLAAGCGFAIPRHRFHPLHPGAQGVHRAGDGRPGPAHGEDPHHHGGLRLHRLGLPAHGPGRRPGQEEDPLRRPARAGGLGRGLQPGRGCLHDAMTRRQQRPGAAGFH